jgi:hypothetical protein
MDEKASSEAFFYVVYRDNLFSTKFAKKML